MKLLRRIPLLISFCVFPLIGNANTISFDDLTKPYPESTLYPIPDGYSGLSWSNFGVTDGIHLPYYTCPNGYCNGIVSSPSVAFNGYSKPASFSSRSPFTLTSLYATGAWQNGVLVRVEGLRAGSVVQSTSFSVSSKTPIKVEFGWSGLQQVRVSSSGGTPAGYGGWGSHVAIDDIEINRSRTYGLFIGVKDVGTPGNSGLGIVTGTMRTDLLAKRLYDAFASHGADAQFLTADISIGEAVTKDNIAKELSKIRERAQPGDTLVLYVGSHGSRALNGSEFMKLGDSEANALYDVELTAMLRQFGDMQKITFLDGCHAGGFWGSTDPEAGMPQLDSLSNIALMAAAPESRLGLEALGLMGFANNGNSAFGDAILEAANLGLDSFPSLESLKEFLFTRTRWHTLLQPEWYEGEFGQPFVPNPNEVSIFDAKSSDFGIADGLMVPSAVPEPETYILFMTGLGLITAFSRRRCGANVGTDKGSDKQR